MSSLLKQPFLPCGPTFISDFVLSCFTVRGSRESLPYPYTEVTGGWSQSSLPSSVTLAWDPSVVRGSLLCVLGMPSASEQACHPGQVSPP